MDSGGSLSTVDAVAITAVVGGVCSFTAGLLLGVLPTRCNVHRHSSRRVSRLRGLLFVRTFNQSFHCACVCLTDSGPLFIGMSVDWHVS